MRAKEQHPSQAVPPASIAAISSGSPWPFGLRPASLLVPVDFSEASKEAFSLALKLAEQFNARLHVIHVLENVTSPDFDSFPIARKSTDMVALAKRKLVEFSQAGGKPLVPVYPEVRCGNPWQVIVDLAAQQKSDLIIIPTHGYTGLKRALIGSVAERVVRHAPCPVLVLRQPAAAPLQPPGRKEKRYED